MRLDDSYKFVNLDWAWADFWIGTQLGCVPLTRSIVERFPEIWVKNIDLSDPDEMILFVIAPESFNFLIDKYYNIDLKIRG